MLSHSYKKHINTVIGKASNDVTLGLGLVWTHANARLVKCKTKAFQGRLVIDVGKFLQFLLQLFRVWTIDDI